jgi:Raf kinase inhibitor-like YbhB/YbcL family protein
MDINRWAHGRQREATGATRRDGGRGDRVVEAQQAGADAVISVDYESIQQRWQRADGQRLRHHRQALVLGGALGSACTGFHEKEEIVTIEVSSSAFEAGATIPKKHTGEGQDVSPPLRWNSLPQGTREIAIICDDPDAPTQKPFVHWVIYKIPADQQGLPEDGIEGALEGMNDFGRRGYDGCMPPQGHGVHHYHFKVYALDAELDAPVGLSKDELLAAVGGSILDEGELVGTYER